MPPRKDVAFAGSDGTVLRGWLYHPASGDGPFPGITMAHGYAGIRQHGLEQFASRFSQAGFAVLLHDHRNFGASDGAIRHEVDPWQQIADWRHAISFLQDQPEVDEERIGLWGTSYAGGHAIVLGATDRRLKAVVAQVPTISGHQQMLRRIPPDAIAGMQAKFSEDERGRARGEPPQRQMIVSADREVGASYHSADAVAFYSQPLGDGVWQNDVTVRSGRAAGMYEPGVWLPRVSPTPVMVVVALHDVITVTDLALAAYEQALEPKRLVLLRGGHFDAYGAEFEPAATAAVEWFEEHLR